MSLRARCNDGTVTLGGWCILPTPPVVEVLARAGFDWISIDAQHGMIGIDGMVAAVGVLAASGTPALVRVAQNDAAEIGKALDAGAEGVIVPMINNAADAARAAAACRYAPRGNRSWGPTRLALSRPEHTPNEMNDEVLCIALVETVEGADNVDEIAAAPGIDGIMIGPTDLAVSMGLLPTTGGTDAEHDRVVQSILSSCRERGLTAGVYCNSVSVAQRRRQEGFTMLAVVTDLTLLLQAARDAVAVMRA